MVFPVPNGSRTYWNPLLHPVAAQTLLYPEDTKESSTHVLATCVAQLGTFWHPLHVVMPVSESRTY